MGCLMNLPWGPRDVRLLWTAAQGLQLWVSGNSSYSSSDAGMHDVPSLPAEQHVLFERSQHAAAAVQYRVKLSCHAAALHAAHGSALALIVEDAANAGLMPDATAPRT